MALRPVHHHGTPLTTITLHLLLRHQSFLFDDWPTWSGGLSITPFFRVKADNAIHSRFASRHPSDHPKQLADSRSHLILIFLYLLHIPLSI